MTPQIKGYYIANGYMGYVNNTYMLFACEEDYLNYIEDIDIEDTK